MSEDSTTPRASFDAMLPAGVPAPTTDRSAQPPTEAGRRARTVLLADDGPMILETIRACLEAAGYRVLTARDGVEAVEVLTAHQTDIGVAVLDVDMPRMGGLEALERMQEIRPDLPALISTGHSAVALGRAWPPSGRVGIVEKPFDLTELLRRVQEVLGGALEPE